MSLLGLPTSESQTTPEDRLNVEMRVTRLQLDLIATPCSANSIARARSSSFTTGSKTSCPSPANPRIRPRGSLQIAHGQMPRMKWKRRWSSSSPTAWISCWHNDRGKRPGHPECQHDHHRQSGSLRSGPFAPASGTGRPIEAPRVLLPAGRPDHQVTPNAAKRLRAIEEYIEIARWLCIVDARSRNPGAGNLLGPQQPVTSRRSDMKSTASCWRWRCDA